MRSTLRSTVLFLACWAILNMGMFGWIKVCSSSGGRAGSGVSAMAEVNIYNDGSLIIRLLGNSLKLGSNT